MIGIVYSQEEIFRNRLLVRQLFLERSKVDWSQQDTLHQQDLYTLFELYDTHFLNRFFQTKYKGRMKLGFSGQLSSSAGITKFPRNFGQLPPEEYSFEIKISSQFLFNYNHLQRDKKVGGIITQDALEAMMLVFEHELCHVIEYVCCFCSSCKKAPFRQLIHGLFGHTESVHGLPANKEINRILYGFRVGQRVRFNFEGATKSGVITGIHKRATVMVQEKGGRYVGPFGRRYVKYYVTLETLQK